MIKNASKWVWWKYIFLRRLQLNDFIRFSWEYERMYGRVLCHKIKYISLTEDTITGALD